MSCHGIDLKYTAGSCTFVGWFLVVSEKLVRCNDASGRGLGFNRVGVVPAEYSVMQGTWGLLGLDRVRAGIEAVLFLGLFEKITINLRAGIASIGRAKQARYAILSVDRTDCQKWQKMSRLAVSSTQLSV